MSEDERAAWEQRHRAANEPGEPEPFVVEVMPLLVARRGLALDAAAGRGRHSILLARAGMRVLAVDYAEAGLRMLLAGARAERLPIWPVLADLASFPIRAETYDAIIDTNFLDRALFPAFKAGLRPGGVLLVDTFLIDQAAFGHLRNPLHLLDRGELRELLSGLDILRYREGRVISPDGTESYRASAIAMRRR
ncbi:MAG TPA: class I SAM-dependent methyltransferase [Candidatus Binataceae bacterium]|nr:class I SAM-dependent methyltransferase [Candidatus Binataceae bacterium]